MRLLDFTGTKGAIEYEPKELEYISFGKKGTLTNTILVKPNTIYAFNPMTRSHRLLYVYTKHEMVNCIWWDKKPELHAPR